MKGIPATLASLCAPAVARLSADAFRLWVSALALVSDRPEPVVLSADLDALPRCPPAGARRGKLVDELTVELWTPVAGGWAVALPARAELAAKRAAAGRAGGQRSVEARRLAFGSAQPPARDADAELTEANAEATSKQHTEATSKQSFKASSNQLEPNAEATSNQTGEAKSEISPCTPSDLQNSPVISGSSGDQPDDEGFAGASERKPRQRRWRRFPADFEPPADIVTLARELGLDLAQQLVLIRDHEFKDPKQDAAATLRRWLRAAKSFGPRAVGGPRVAQPRQPNRGYDPARAASEGIP